MIRLKPIKKQVIVLTGATSGIGLATAREAAKAGARLVLAARTEDALRTLVQEIQDHGGQATYVAADVGKEEQVRQIARVAIAHFGGFDTWINDAAVSIYGKLTDISMEDQRKLFETNLWGVVHGSRVAVEHLRARGGALINIGSVVSERAIPLQGIYSASKHAVKAYTDALRMELEKEGAPISVTLIKPGSIDTPYTQHAKNYMDADPDLPPPVYSPALVAKAILYCAEHPKRDFTVGGGGWMLETMEHLAPGATDSYMKRFLFGQQRKQEQQSRRNPEGNLYKPGADLRERGDHKGHVSEKSIYTSASLHPIATSVLALGTGMLLAATMQARSSSRASDEQAARTAADAQH